MKNVSLPRLWKVLRWQMPGVTMLTIVLAVMVMMFMAFRLIDVGTTDLSEEAIRKGANKAVDTCWTTGANMLCIMVCSMFNRLSSKQMACGYLMLPATMQEKFIATVLIFTVGGLFIWFTGFVVADLLCSGLYHALFPSAFVSGLPELLRRLMLSDYYADGRFVLPMLLDDLCPLLWWHSFCVLLATIIRRNAILYAIMPLLLLFPFMWLRDHFATEMAGGLYDSWSLPVAILLSLLAIIHYTAAYRLFPRRTLIGHKHLAFL